ncbi:transcriptional regulator AraC/XylS family domain protein, partial [Vibrio cholerae HC-57A1]
MGFKMALKLSWGELA